MHPSNNIKISSMTKYVACCSHHGLLIVSLYTVENSCVSVIMGKSEVSTFDCDQIIGARKAHYSVSTTTELLRFSCHTITSIYKNHVKSGKTCNQWKKCNHKCAVDSLVSIDWLCQKASNCYCGTVTLVFREETLTS